MGDMTTGLTAETLQLVGSYLTLEERFAFWSTSRSVLEEEPLMTDVTSYCGKCDDCRLKNFHLCVETPRAYASEGFFKSLLRYSHQQLKVLRLANTPAFNENVLKAANHALLHLRELELNRCGHLGASGMAQVARQCRQLEAIHFRDMPLDLEALRQLILNNRKTLRIVDFTGCHTITGNHVMTLSVCSNLSDLCLSGCHNVDNKAIMHVVERCLSLTRLNLRYCHQVDDRLVALVVEHLPSLRDLNLRYCYKVSDKAVDAICVSLPWLECLNLSQCSRITDHAIVRIVSTLSQLKELRLWGCTKLTSAAVYAISAGLPSLTLVDIRSRDKFEAVIGGPTALKFLIQTYRNTLAKWEQTNELGVFKRPVACIAAA